MGSGTFVLFEGRGRSTGVEWFEPLGCGGGDSGGFDANHPPGVCMGCAAVGWLGRGAGQLGRCLSRDQAGSGGRLG